MAEEAEGTPTSVEKDEPALPLKLDSIRQLKIGMATLAACMAESAAESDPEFRDRFVARLGQAFEQFRKNSDTDPLHVLEVLHWTGELLNGWNPIPGREGSLFGSSFDEADHDVSTNASGQAA